jgi:hypothetical protein
MNARTKSALLWGLVGAMAFLALHQGYVLAGNTGVGLLPAIGVGVAVGAVATAVSYVAEPRIRDGAR